MHRVAPGGLGLVQRCIGLSKQAGSVVVGAGHTAPQSDTETQLDFIAGKACGAAGNGLSQALQRRHCANAVGFGQQQQKFLAAIAAQTVSLAQALLQLAHAMAQHLVTGQVPVQVVDAFEVVDVDHGHGQAALRVPGAVQLDDEALEDRPAIVGTREHIAQGQVLQA
ncbi:hypothetical protein D3C80_1121440 [compost metagenome]